MSFPTDRERAHRARQAAEALFAPKPSPRVDKPAASRSLAAVDKREPTPAAAAPGPAIPNAADTVAGNAPQAGPQIPPAHARRIRTWLRYGMSMAEVAAVYGVQIGAVERILRQA